MSDDDILRVFHDEVEGWVVPRRKAQQPQQLPGKVSDRYAPRVSNRLLGLALSGGGVRSSTYALGALQRLARLGVLQHVDYLSTASGGTYLGAAWSSLAADDPANGSRPGNFPFRFVDDRDPGLFDRESSGVRHLRAHGNWLAPHLGLSDVWTWVALFRYLSSVVINITLVPIPWLVALLGLTMMVSGSWWNRQHPWESDIFVPMIAVPAGLFGLFLFLAWYQPGRNVVGAEFKHGLYPVQMGLLVAALAFVLTDLFVLALAGAYALRCRPSPCPGTTLPQLPKTSQPPPPLGSLEYQACP